MPLKQLGEILNLPKGQLPEEMAEFDSLNDIDKTEMSKYIERDTEIPMKAIQMLKGKLKEEGINLKRLCTISQIAIGFTVNKLKKDKWADQIWFDKRKGIVRSPKIIEKDGYEVFNAAQVIHDAYRGGMVRCWKTGMVNDVTYIDCNSLWPYAAANMP